MKRWIHADTSLDDGYNLKQYFPKKVLRYIKELNMQPDFDNRSGRTVHRYYAYFIDDDYVSAVGLPNFQTAVRKAILDKMEKGELS